MVQLPASCGGLVGLFAALPSIVVMKQVPTGRGTAEIEFLNATGAPILSMAAGSAYGDISFTLTVNRPGETSCENQQRL